MSFTAASLHADATHLSENFDELLASADELFMRSGIGAHGRRRRGQGAEFWQYRPYEPHDSQRDIDWRRSARGDGVQIREKELELAQEFNLWVDDSASMRFSTLASGREKYWLAAVLGLASAQLLSRGGERVGLLNDEAGPKLGVAGVDAIAAKLAAAEAGLEYGRPSYKAVARGSHALFLSDFLGDWDEVVEGLSFAAMQGARGLLVQVLDPEEAKFGFSNRVIFESAAQEFEFETKQASGLRAAYLERLEERYRALQDLAARLNWRFMRHVTDQDPSDALLWISYGLTGQR